MMRRAIDTAVWDDPWFAHQDPEAKLLFLYLLTNRRPTVSGVFEISLRMISFETGLARTVIADRLDKFPNVEWVQGNHMIRVLDWARFVRVGRLPSHRWSPLRKAVFKRDGFQCVYCGSLSGPFECDHVFPISKGGADDLDNLVTACRSCNRSKRDKTLEEWR